MSLLLSLNQIPHDYMKDRECIICKEEDSSKQNPLLAHVSEKEEQTLHIAHRECWKKWANTPVHQQSQHSPCPLCRKQIDTRALFPWRERAVLLAKKHFKHGAVAGIAAAAFTQTINIIGKTVNESDLMTRIIVGAACGAWVASKIHRIIPMIGRTLETIDCSPQIVITGVVVGMNMGNLFPSTFSNALTSGILASISACTFSIFEREE